MRNNKASTLKIAATYIGTVVGAGFATGQEVLQYFSVFGVNGVWGITLATVLFIIFGVIIIGLGCKIQAKSHLDIVKHSSGKVLGFALDVLISFFLFGALTAMIAGTGALFAQQFGLSNVLGNLLMAVLTATTVLLGINAVINSISVIVPFLLASVIGICIFSITKMPPDIAAGAVLDKSGLVNNWFLSAILYVSYNIILSIAVLGPLGARAKNKKAILHGSILGGLGLGIGSALIFFAISGNISNVRSLEVPMAFIAGNISNAAQIAFTIILIAEIYTTAIGSLFGFTARLVDIEKRPLKGKTIIISATIAAFFASLLGFSNLVKYLYSLVGYGGILLLISLLYSSLQARFK